MDGGHQLRRDRRRDGWLARWEQGRLPGTLPAGPNSVNGAVTYLYGVNNGGYLTGYYISPETGLYTGFLTSPTGVLTSFQYASNVGTMPRD